MFYGVEDFPFLKVLEDNFTAIKAEALDLSPQELMPYPEQKFYNRGWWVCPLVSADFERELGDKVAHNRRRCPLTAEVLAGLPGTHLAGFSILEPGCEMEPHVHHQGFFICHLGLVIPPQCGIAVKDETRVWREGEVLAFHETDEHYAWNRGPERRIILLADFQPADSPR